MSIIIFPTGSSGSKAYTSVVGGVNNVGVIIYSFYLNISPKMSYVVLVCDTVMLLNSMLVIL